MNRYSNVRDLTVSKAKCSPGVTTRRMCWGCSKPRLEIGGKVNPRTRMWSCASCVEASNGR